MAGRPNIFKDRTEDPVARYGNQEYTTVWITATIYADVTPNQLREIRRTNGDFTISDKGPRNAITIQGYRDQELEGRLLNAFLNYDPNAYRA